MVGGPVISRWGGELKVLSSADGGGLVMAALLVRPGKLHKFFFKAKFNLIRDCR